MSDLYAVRAREDAEDRRQVWRWAAVVAACLVILAALYLTE